MTKRGGEDSGGNGGCRFRAVAGTLQVCLLFNGTARVDVARRRDRKKNWGIMTNGVEIEGNCLEGGDEALS